MSKSRKDVISKETKKRILISIISIILVILFITVFLIILRTLLIKFKIIGEKHISVSTCAWGLFNLGYLLVAYRAIKKPIKSEVYENGIVDERTKIINEKVGSKVFEFYAILQVLATLICAFIGQNLIANVLICSFAIQAILYIYFYSVENQKS